MQPLPFQPTPIYNGSKTGLPLSKWHFPAISPKEGTHQELFSPITGLLSAFLKASPHVKIVNGCTVCINHCRREAVAIAGFIVWIDVEVEVCSGEGEEQNAVKSCIHFQFSSVLLSTLYLTAYDS